MKSIRPIVTLLSLFMVSTAFAAPSDSDAYCDYYDDYSGMLVSFPAQAERLPSGPSALSGIGMILPDGSELGIAPTMAGDDDDWAGHSVTRDRWYESNMEEGCHTVPMPPEKGRQILCPHALYTLLYKPATYQGGPDIYIYVHHLFNGDSPSPYYQKVMD